MKGKNDRPGRKSSNHNSSSRNPKNSRSTLHVKRTRQGSSDLSVRGRQPAGSSILLRVSLGIHAVKEALKVRPTEVFKLIIRKKIKSKQQ